MTYKISTSYKFLENVNGKIFSTRKEAKDFILENCEVFKIDNEIQHICSAKTKHQFSSWSNKQNPTGLAKKAFWKKVIKKAIG